MSTIEIRKELHQYIDNSTDNIVAAVFALFKTYNNGYAEAGTDITTYNQEIDEAMAEINSGIFSSHDDIKKALRKY